MEMRGSVGILVNLVITEGDHETNGSRRIRDYFSNRLGFIFHLREWWLLGWTGRDKVHSRYQMNRILSVLVMNDEWKRKKREGGEWWKILHIPELGWTRERTRHTIFTHNPPSSLLPDVAHTPSPPPLKKDENESLDDAQNWLKRDDCDGQWGYLGWDGEGDEGR